MAAIKELSYRTFDQMLDSVRLDLKSFQSAGDIDGAELIKKAQQINYELGLKIHQMKETMIEVNHRIAKLPGDFYQAQLALICHNYRHIQNQPWNGNVLLEQLEQPLQYNTTQYAQGQQLNPQCDICNVVHNGPCPELVINPYPLGKCRSICNDNINIKILTYGESEVFCYEQFERLYIVPHIQASAFSSEDQFRNGNWRNEGSIYNGFLETNIECGKIYLSYLGGLEDEQGNLLVLNHPVINNYYTWACKRIILEDLWMNGEPLKDRVDYASKKEDQYRYDSLSIANMPDFRQTMKTINVLKKQFNRDYSHVYSRYWGYLGWANPVDDM